MKRSPIGNSLLTLLLMKHSPIGNSLLPGHTWDAFVDEALTHRKAGVYKGCLHLVCKSYEQRTTIDNVNKILDLGSLHLVCKSYEQRTTIDTVNKIVDIGSLHLVC